MSHPIKQSQQRDEGEEECKSLFLHCLENWEGLHGDIKSELVLSGCGAAVGESTGVCSFRDESAPPPLHPPFHLGAEAQWDVFAHFSFLLVMFFCFTVELISLHPRVHKLLK